MNQTLLKTLAQQYVDGLIGDVEFLTQTQVPAEIHERLTALAAMPQSVHLKLSIEDIWPPTASKDKAALAIPVSQNAAKRQYWTKLENFAEGLVIDFEAQLRISLCVDDEYDAENPEYAFAFASYEASDILYEALCMHATAEVGCGIRALTGSQFIIGGELLRRLDLEVTPELLFVPKPSAKTKRSGNKLSGTVVRQRYLEELLRVIVPEYSAQAAQAVIDHMTIVKQTRTDCVLYIFSTHSSEVANNLLRSAPDVATGMRQKGATEYEITIASYMLAQLQLTPPDAALTAALDTK